MSLLAWRDTPHDVEAEIREILQRSGAADRSTDACKAWARRLIRLHVPTWEPGVALSVVNAQRIGAEFERQLATVRPQLPSRVRAVRRSA